MTFPPSDPPRKLLFVCSRNKVRSLTAERLLEGVPGYVARSAGTQPGARVVVTAKLIGWADVIFAMESSHRRRLEERHAEALAAKELVVLHIPDDFEYLDEDLFEVLRGALGPHVALPAEE